TMAGIMLPERILDPGAREVAERTIATNLLGTIRLVHAFAPALTARPEAAILTVTSGLAYVPLPISPTYSATKAAVHSYTESLREQLRDTSVQVIEIVPPLTRTDLMGSGTNNDPGDAPGGIRVGGHEPAGIAAGRPADPGGAGEAAAVRRSERHLRP